MPDPVTPEATKTPESSQEVKVTAADARTYLADFVSDPESLKTLEDDKVLGLHKKVTDAVTKLTPKVEPPKAPEKYEFKFKDDIQLDPESLKLFEPVLRKHGISQEVAQDLANVMLAEFDRQDGVINSMFSGQQESWESSSRQDKEIGGANFDANLRLAQTAVGKFFTPAFKEILDSTGLGSHPEFIRGLAKIGKATAEDRPPVSGGATRSEQDVARKLFNHPTSQNFT